MHVYVEGIDLSGKSSAVAEVVAQSEEPWDVQHGQLGPDGQLYVSATAGFSRYSLDVVGDLLSAAIRADLEMFDHSFVFTASPEARRARLEQRMAERPHEISPIDRALADSPEFAAVVNKHITGLTQEAFGATLIDTTDLPIRAVGGVILNTIGGIR